MQLVVRNARLLDDTDPERRVDIIVEAGEILAIEPAGVSVGAIETELDVHGALVTPPYVEPHVHLDTCLTAGEPRWNESGTLWEGIQRWSERKARSATTTSSGVSRRSSAGRWRTACSMSGAMSTRPIRRSPRSTP